MRGEGLRSGRVAASGVECDSAEESDSDVCCQEVVSPYSLEVRLQTCLLPLLRLALAAWYRCWPEERGSDSMRELQVRNCFLKYDLTNYI